jgi:hypothetical protein
MWTGNCDSNMSIQSALMKARTLYVAKYKEAWRAYRSQHNPSSPEVQLILNRSGVAEAYRIWRVDMASYVDKQLAPVDFSEGALPLCCEAKLSVARRPANSLSMNLRHAAALALVGWYLIVGPNPMGGCIGCTHSSPGWVWGVYSNASDCQRVQKKLTAMFVENQKHPESKWQEILGSGCDSSDDPMFKAKGLQLKFLSPSEKNAIITTGVSD